MTREEADAKLTLESFIEFLKSKPADEEYDYMDSYGCPLAEHLAGKENKYTEEVNVTAFVVEVKDAGHWHILTKVPDELDAVVRNLPYTYGAALARAGGFKAAQI